MGSVKALQTDYEELLACNKMAVSDLQSLLAWLDDLVTADALQVARIEATIMHVINVLEEDN